MDLLKAELERKRRAVAEAGAIGSSSSNSKKKRYLTAAERRRLEEEEEDREEEERRERKRQKRKRKKKRSDGSDDEEEGKEEEDLTTMLTKKYDPKERKKQYEDGASAAAGIDNKGKISQEENKSMAQGETKENQSNNHGGNNDSNNTIIPESLQKLSRQEVTNTLRRFGLPIRLFGEQTIIHHTTKNDDAARLKRLHAAMQGREAAMLGEAEEDEYLLDNANRTRNVFLEKDEVDSKPTKTDGGTAPTTTTTTTAVALTKEELNDKPKRIYRYFKTLLRQWEEDLAQRPDSIKRTAVGKNETKTLKQCKDYIRPLFKECKRRELAEDLETHLFKIVTYCEEGEFVKAHDSYIDVAIGRAAWPIGVTMVGIHARSGRAKIESSNVAHVMNSELHRKYLTSVKRLMSYDQKKRVDVNPSKKVTNC